jgi:CDP-4-dehydro-6-deoxyglucose reductase/terephthalate 1,2-dioxygenase reductase component
MSHLIQIADSAVSFACGSDETILDAALKAGIQIPYSCKKGVCGNCAARIEKGDFQRSLIWPEAKLTGQELLCQCRPQTDLVIKPPQWHQSIPAETKKLQVKVYRNVAAAPDVNLLHLRLPTGQRIKFRAGQYLNIVLPDGQLRSYSMANPPHESDSIQLHVRHVDGGLFSEIARLLDPGDVLDVELPFGQVQLAQDDQSHLLCVCGGTGFAPVKSLLDDLAKQKSQRQITLLWGSKDAAGLYLLDHIAKWQKSLPGFKFQAAIETESDALTLGAFHGRVDGALLALGSESMDLEVYCCGSPNMVSAVKKVCLNALGLHADKFHADVFVTNQTAGATHPS